MLVHRMGDYVTLGGKVAVRDHVSIASKVCIQEELYDLQRKNVHGTLGLEFVRVGLIIL